MKIRKAGKEDQSTIVSFNCAMALETEKKILDPKVAESGVRRLLEHDEYGFYLLAYSENRPLGQLMITYEWTDWRDGLFWWIQSVYVLPEHRGKGIYKALYEYILQESRNNTDIKGIRLYVDQSNADAKEVYEKLGMKKAHYDLYEVDFIFQG